MSLFLTLAFLFFIGAVAGWILELLFRRVRHGKWINPGFLKGPYLPIYGLGVVIMFLICRVDFSWIQIVALQHIVRILFMGIAMTLIEYIGGIIFIKGMKIKLWDYSGQWGNIQGIICPLFSLIWTAVGAAYYYILNPVILESVQWFTDNIQFSFFVGMFFGVFFVDLATTLQISVKITRFAKENKLVVKYEALKAEIKERMRESKEKYKISNFINPFKGDLKENLARNVERWGEYVKGFKKNKKDKKSDADKENDGCGS